LQTHGAGGAYIAAAAAAGAAAVAVVAVYFRADFLFVVTHGLASDSQIKTQCLAALYSAEKICVYSPTRAEPVSVFIGRISAHAVLLPLAIRRVFPAVNASPVR